MPVTYSFAKRIPACVLAYNDLYALYDLVSEMLTVDGEKPIIRISIMGKEFSASETRMKPVAELLEKINCNHIESFWIDVDSAARQSVRIVLRDKYSKPQVRIETVA